MSQTHPDRLASVATLFGMSPAAVTKCRLLEIGCGDGSNLIPMAYDLPDSRFVGIDLANAPIEAGRRAIRELGLDNIELKRQDLREIGEDAGEFDYIAAHGLYSWVPPEVRERLLGLCCERLTPQGVAFISYNAYPGRHVREMFREMMLYHTRALGDAAAKIESARDFLKLMGESRMVSRAWRPMVDDEIERLLKGNAAWLYHDDLSPINDSFYFREFAERAAAHGLQYLGDAEAHLMFDPAGALATVTDDFLEREQYLDFLYLRRLRQTLLCRREVPLDRQIGPAHMERFLFSSPSRESDGQIEGLNSVRITAAHEAVARAARAMGEVYPQPVSFEELLPYAGDREGLREMLFALVRGGFAEFHVYDFPCEAEVVERPRATRLARWQSENSAYISCLGHGTVELDSVARALVKLLDGTRGLDALARDLALAGGAPALSDIRRMLPGRLEWMAGMGLLAGEKRQ